MAKARHRLKALRKQRRFTQESLAQHLNVGTSTVRAWEQGLSSPFPENQGALADALGISDAELDAVLNGHNGHVGHRWFNVFIDLEQSATSIRTWEPVLVPGLLQTKEYALAVVHGDDEVIAQRLARQAALEREDGPLQLVAVLDESVLHRPVGGMDVLAGQLDHLLAESERTNVHVHVFPFRAEPPPFATSSVVILGFSWGDDGMVYVQRRRGATYLDLPDEIGAYADDFRVLIDLSLSRSETRDLVAARRKELEL